MDSLTQIVLGAACGEAVLGRKIGNKALLFGAIGGTIPDLDVLVGNLFYNNEIDVMLFHRGFMHSILFSVIAAFVLGLMVFKLYNTGKRFNTTTQNDWSWLFFISLFTHPLLDCFTPYGTQLFSPFSNYRVAFNTIAVVDPIYTLPFLISLIVLMFYSRQSNYRKHWLKLGIGISSVYLLFTIGNKLYINSLFKQSLKDSDISYTRYSNQPAIFNNILWYGIAESNDNYFVANYSLFDTQNRFLNFKKIPKERDLKPEVFQDIKNLAWFSDDYYSISKLDDNVFIYNDLRYPILESRGENRSVFSLNLYKDAHRLNMKPFEPKFDDFNTLISNLWERIKGI